MSNIILLLVVFLIIVIGSIGLYRLFRMGFTYERRIEKDPIRGKRLPPDYDEPVVDIWQELDAAYYKQFPELAEQDGWDIDEKRYKDKSE